MKPLRFMLFSFLCSIPPLYLHGLLWVSNIDMIVLSYHCSNQTWKKAQIRTQCVRKLWRNVEIFGMWNIIHPYLQAIYVVKNSF